MDTTDSHKLEAYRNILTRYILMAVGDIHELNELLENAIAIYKMTIV